ncbi:helix-turn-helix transcriptional regulator [Corynebacterium flavescens]
MTPPTITLAKAADLIGIGRSTAYQAVRSNEFPAPVIKIGGRYVVPTRPLLELLGLDELPTDEDPKAVA